MKSKHKRQGIAIISLVIIIIVLLMIASMATFISTDIISDTRKVEYAKNMKTISDAVEEYYSVNGDIPVLSSGTELTALEYKSRINSEYGSEYLQVLADEMHENGDENAVFYELDISKIGIKDLTYGIKENIDDFYLISSDSHIVYYFKGFIIGNKIFFSNPYILDN